MEIFSKENVAALITVIAGLGAYFLQHRWVVRRQLRDNRRIARRLLQAHSDAEAVFDYLDHLCEAVSQRGRLRLSTLVIERAVRNSCERLTRTDRYCAFRASEFLASLDVFERGLRRLEYLMAQFIETYPENGNASERHLYVRRLICGQAKILKKDRLTALGAELGFLKAMPNRIPEDFMVDATKTSLLQTLSQRIDVC